MGRFWRGSSGAGVCVCVCVCVVREGDEPHVSRERPRRMDTESTYPVYLDLYALQLKNRRRLRACQRKPWLPPRPGHLCVCSFSMVSRTWLSAKLTSTSVSTRDVPRQNTTRFYLRSFLFSSTLAKVPRELKVL